MFTAGKTQGPDMWLGSFIFNSSTLSTPAHTHTHTSPHTHIDIKSGVKLACSLEGLLLILHAGFMAFV